MIQIKEKRTWIWLSNICLRTGVTEAHVIALAGYRPGKATPKSIETLDTWELWGAVNIITTSVCLSIYLPSYAWCDCKLATWRFDASGFACVGVCWFQIPTCCKTDSHLCEAGSAYLDSYDRFFFTIMYLIELIMVIHHPGMRVAFEVYNSRQKKHGTWRHGTSNVAVSILALQYRIPPTGPQNEKSKLSQGF